MLTSPASISTPHSPHPSWCAASIHTPHTWNMLLMWVSALSILTLSPKSPTLPMTRVPSPMVFSITLWL